MRCACDHDLRMHGPDGHCSVPYCNCVTCQPVTPETIELAALHRELHLLSDTYLHRTGPAGRDLIARWLQGLPPCP